MNKLEQQYLATKKVMDNLKLHLKTQREDLNVLAERLLESNDEYIFSNGELVLKRPANHTAIKIKK